jgi:hypothetical protein
MGSLKKSVVNGIYMLRNREMTDTEVRLLNLPRLSINSDERFGNRIGEMIDYCIGLPESAQRAAYIH